MWHYTILYHYAQTLLVIMWQPDVIHHLAVLLLDPHNTQGIQLLQDIHNGCLY